MRQLHNLSSAPSLDGNYSQGVEVHTPGRFLHISGQIPERPDGSVSVNFEEQCHAVWANIFAILKSACMTGDDLVKVTTFLSDRKYRDANLMIRQQLLGDHRPALTVVITRIYDARWLLEIEAEAFAASE